MNKKAIYILTNPSFPQFVKIGYADDVIDRVDRLNSNPGLPYSFRIYATYEVNERLDDLKLHKMIDALNPTLRTREEVDGKQRKREFFAMSAEVAYNILRQWQRLVVHEIDFIYGKQMQNKKLKKKMLRKLEN